MLASHAEVWRVLRSMWVSRLFRIELQCLPVCQPCSLTSEENYFIAKYIESLGKYKPICTLKMFVEPFTFVKSLI